MLTALTLTLMGYWQAFSTFIHDGDKLNPESDPRVFFAAERTLLAWLRTGIAAIGLGFLVARFGIFLMIINGSTLSSHYVSTLIGIGLVMLGTVMIAASAWQHGQFLKTLKSHDLPPRYSARLSLALASLMVLSGISLALYLAFATENTELSHAPGPTARPVSIGTSSPPAR